MSHLTIAFVITTILAIYLFVRSHRNPGALTWLLPAYAMLQYGVAATGFYEGTTSLPPAFIFNVLPAILAITWLFLTERGKAFSRGFLPERMIWVHVVRVPVEVILFGLFTVGLVPEIMTFAGRNFDILAGLTAPVVWFLAFHGKTLPPAFLQAWHVAALLLLLNIVVTAVLSAPFPFQQFGFEQPNVGLLAAPFNLLPGVVVPVVFVSHILGLRNEDE